MPFLLFLKPFGQFIVDNWRPFLFAAICWYCYHENNRATEAENALHTYQQVIAQQVADQAKSNEIIETKSTKQVEAIETTHIAEVKKLTQNGTDRTQLENEIKHEYQNRIANLTDAQRLLTKQISDSSTMPTATEAASDTTSGAECHTAIVRLQTERESLENACAITTSDFNACAGYVETVTNLFGTK